MRRSFLAGFLSALLTWNTSFAATPFIWSPGTSNNGEIGPVITLMTTELESLAAAAVIVSSVNGTSGVFTNSNTSQAIWGVCTYNTGNAGAITTPGAGANLAGWFLTSLDGSTFELTTAAPPRPPDFIIPLQATTTANSQTFNAVGLVLIPAVNFKVLIQNNAANTLGAGATTAPYIKCAPTAVQY